MSSEKTIQADNRKNTIIYFSALFLGLILGYLGNNFLNNVFDFIATVFTRLFSFIAIPVIAFSLINTLANLGTSKESKLIFKKTVFYTLLTTLLAAFLALIIYLIFSPAKITAELANYESAINTSYKEHFLSVIPNNLLQPFLAGNVLSVLFIAAAFGMALSVMRECEQKKVLLNFFSGIQMLLFILIKWLIAILPLGILAFSAQLAAQMKAGVIVGSLATYFSAVISANLIQMFLILPALLVLRKLNPIKIFKGMLPALAVALFSKSSAGTLPVTISCAEKNLGVDNRVSRFTLPICTTINMNGCAAFILITSLYLMANAGLELSTLTLLSWVLIASVAAIGNAGVPMGCFFLTISLMSSIDVPVNLMGVILPVYAVIDMIETSLNVWSDSCVCNIVNKEASLQ